MATFKMAVCLMAILRVSTAVETLQNLCDIEVDTMSMYCYCDSSKLHDAHWASCWLINATSPTDLIWHSFQTQTQLQELRFNVFDGRLTFVPTSALQHLGNLSILELTYAEINVLEANSFNGLASVRNLGLKRNDVIFSTISFFFIFEIKRDH